jgi:hypothetical protein
MCIDFTNGVFMKKLLIALTILPTFASAHIIPGTWKGVTSNNTNCFMEVGAQTFENNLKHPLNERIAITIGSVTYSIHHPYSINANEGSVSFNHDLFEAVVPTNTGAYALQIKMAHTDDYEGPTSLSVMEHNWKTNTKEIFNCNELKIVR